MAERTSVWRADVVGWALYDFANTIYSMNIVSLYLKRYIVEDLGYSDHWFDIPFALSMLIAALTLPALGTLSDHSAHKKRYLLGFTSVCCASVAVLGVVPSAWIGMLVVLFIVANYCYDAAQPFYNTLLYSVAEGEQARFVSGFGVAFGYIGSVVGMLLVLPFVTGSLFGLEIPFITGSGKTGAFIPTAALFLIFSLPLFLWVKEYRAYHHTKEPLRKAYRDVWEGLRNTDKYPGVRRFLIADYFFEDAVATVILNIGLYCSAVLNMGETQITLFLIISTTTAVIGSFIIGKIAQIWKLKPLLGVIMVGWCVALLLFVLIDAMPVIWVLGSVVGVLLGGLWTTARPLLAELVPKEDLGRFFGLYALSGRAAAVIGPLIWTVIIYLFQADRPLGQALARLVPGVPTAALPYKLGILSLALMIVVGLIIFRKVPSPERYG